MRFRHIFTYFLMAAFLAPAYGQNTAGSSIASKTLLSYDGARKVEQRVYDNGLGDIVQMITRTVPMIRRLVQVVDIGIVPFAGNLLKGNLTSLIDGINQPKVFCIKPVSHNRRYLNKFLLPLPSKTCIC